MEWAPRPSLKLNSEPDDGGSRSHRLRWFGSGTRLLIYGIGRVPPPQDVIAVATLVVVFFSRRYDVKPA